MILVKLDRWLVSQVAGQPAGARQQNTARRLAALRWVPAHLFSRACCGPPRSDFLLVVFSIAENHPDVPPRPGCAAAALPAPAAEAAPDAAAAARTI